MAKSDLNIEILGTNLTISADETPEYLNMLLDKYRRTIESVQQTTGLKDPLKTAVLTGFLLCDDLEKAGSTANTVKTEDEEQGEAERLTQGMISRLNEIIPNTQERDVYPEALAANPPVFKLKNAIKNYDWGSSDWIPALLGHKNISRIPQAELWMGVNPSAPSRTELPDGKSGPLLSELIEREKEAFLGREIAQKYGTLPFLLKILAAEKPLSIQAHPNLRQARDGFEKENLKGIPPDAPNRNYRDPSDKPEIICALSHFAALCGFRDVREICFLIETISMESEGTLKQGFEKLVVALKKRDGNPLKDFLSTLFGMNSEWLEMLGPFLKKQQEQFERDFQEYKNEWTLCVYLSELFPKDHGILAPLYLNIIELAPGEAMYVPPGILHSYIKGMGIELMADSDNVLRGGLSSKHTDTAELLSVLEFSQFKPEIMKLPDPVSFRFMYPAPIGDFSLSVMHGLGTAVPYNETGPSILIVTTGTLIINQSTVLETGESAFIPPLKTLEFSGTFTAYLALAKIS
jgi:mannose-6-phosphate isomerase